MSNLFGMMNSSTTGLQASQVGINTTSNNILNVNTVGYTRQRTVYGTNTPVYFRGVGYTGAGVHVQDIQRLRDQHLEAQVRTENSKYNELGAKLEGLEQIESIFGEPSDTGLSAIFNDFFNNLEELKKDPSNKALQSLIKENGQTIADTVNQFTTQLDKLSQNTSERKEDLLSTAMDLMDSIKAVNENLEKAYKTDPTKSPNELLDQRDNLLRELSGIMDIDVKINDNQTVSVSIKTEDGPVSINDINSKEQLADIEGKIESGAIKGYNDQLAIIESYKTSVNELA
ncbi:MAG TPA: flagellar hook-associated protein FlgK, partial [Firmicutes bacterium]|nr:flagellar hook-associated protein FlgK [Bacillota bacterium]